MKAQDWEYIYDHIRVDKVLGILTGNNARYSLSVKLSHSLCQWLGREVPSA